MPTKTAQGANSSQKIEGYGVLVYGTYRPDDYYINATFGYGLNNYDSTRLALGGANVADYDGTQIMTRMEAGKVLNYGKWEVTPHLGLRANFVSIDGYTETGPLPTTVASQDITSVRGVLGVGARYTHEMENGAKLVPEFHLRGIEELADPNEAITGSIVGGGSFVSQSEGRDRFSLAAGAGLTYEIDDKVSVRLLYDGEFQSDYQEHGLTAAIRFAFLIFRNPATSDRRGRPWKGGTGSPSEGCSLRWRGPILPPSPERARHLSDPPGESRGVFHAPHGRCPRYSFPMTDDRMEMLGNRFAQRCRAHLEELRRFRTGEQPLDGEGGAFHLLVHSLAGTAEHVRVRRRRQQGGGYRGGLPRDAVRPRRGHAVPRCADRRDREDRRRRGKLKLSRGWSGSPSASSRPMNCPSAGTASSPSRARDC